MQKDKICVLCGKAFKEYGNNPAPLKDEGECCDSCNDTKVLPARFKGAFDKPKQPKVRVRRKSLLKG